MGRTVTLASLLSVSLLWAANLSPANAQAIAAAGAFDPGIEGEFRDGMMSYAARDYHHAEAVFRRILDRDPRLLRVRLELARTLFMQNKDEQADYHFRMAAGEHPSAQVTRNILRFREAIRARRAWRFNFEVGFAPDTNVNSATDKDTVDIYGLPFRLDPSGKARSGMGRLVSADASIRLNRDGRFPIYIGAYGRSLRYGDHRFDDAYAGVDAGPEFQLAEGHLRTTVTGLMRWYGKQPLVRNFGARADYEKVVAAGWTLGGTLVVRHNDYTRRDEVDGWDAEARLAANHALGATTLGFAYGSVQRNWAKDPGQSFWREQLGIGVVKEIGWGLRPQLSLYVAREFGDGELAPFGTRRRDWLMEGSFSIYKRDWNLRGFAPSLSVTWTRNRSSLTLYDEKRLRAEMRFAKAF